MPFIPSDRRPPLLTGDIAPASVGEMCFLAYAQLKEAWRKERRWTTVHNEFCRMFDVDDETAAKVLAFMEFYVKEAHIYELEMEEKNGGI